MNVFCFLFGHKNYEFPCGFFGRMFSDSYHDVRKIFFDRCVRCGYDYKEKRGSETESSSDG